MYMYTSNKKKQHNNLSNSFFTQKINSSFSHMGGELQLAAMIAFMLNKSLNAKPKFVHLIGSQIWSSVSLIGLM